MGSASAEVPSELDAALEGGAVGRVAAVAHGVEGLGQLGEGAALAARLELVQVLAVAALRRELQQVAPR